MTNAGTLRAAVAALNDAILADVATAVTRSTAAAQEADKQRDSLHHLIRCAITSGTSVADLVHVTGLTRARIYQIRDHRR